MQIEKKCLMCRKVHVIEVNQKGYHDWKHGLGIQYALPELSNNERELLMSDICGDCFDKLFE